MSAAHAFVAVVARGVDRGAEWTLREGEGPLAIGTASECAIVLHDPRVAPRHASFAIEDGAVRVLDLGSAAGTWVNGVRVRDASLAGTGEVVVADTTLHVARATGPDLGFGRFLGASPQIRALIPLFERLARSDVPVILRGETGTGKEVLARALHDASARASGPFVVFDCTRGAATFRPAAFAAAHGGTVLLDEIGELDVAVQSKLLRVIERGEIRVDAAESRRVNARVLCSTRRDLVAAMREGTFRDDLYYRLSVARIDLPPLREREGDVEYLAAIFWSRLADGGEPIPAPLLDSLREHDWPGNTRELENAVAQFHALRELRGAKRARAVIPAAHAAAPEPWLDALAARFVAERKTFYEARDALLATFGRAYLEAALSECGGNVSKASVTFGIARSHFYSLLAKTDVLPRTQGRPR